MAKINIRYRSHSISINMYHETLLGAFAVKFLEMQTLFMPIVIIDSFVPVQ